MHKALVLHEVLADPLDAERRTLANAIPGDIKYRKVVIIEHAFEDNESALPLELVPVEIQLGEVIVTLNNSGKRFSYFIGEEVLGDIEAPEGGVLIEGLQQLKNVFVAKLVVLDIEDFDSAFLLNN